MLENEVVEFCIKHRIKVEQYFFMWFILKKDWSKPYEQSLVKRYLKIAKFNMEDIDDLEERGLVVNLNTPPNTLPEFYMVNEEIAGEMFAGEDSGEQLWKAYPASFPLSGGGNFVARAGGDRDDLIDEYLKRIGNSPSKHQFVMKQLSRYKELVKDGKLNGHKLSDFIKMELWDVVADIDKDKPKTQGFGRNI